VSEVRQSFQADAGSREEYESRSILNGAEVCVIYREKPTGARVRLESLTYRQTRVVRAGEGIGVRFRGRITPYPWDRSAIRGHDLVSRFTKDRQKIWGRKMDP